MTEFQRDDKTGTKPMSAHGTKRRVLMAWSLWLWLVTSDAAGREPLPGTDSLDWEGDLATRLVDQVDAFLLRQLERSVTRRESHWMRDFASAEAYERSILPQRQQLAHRLGVRDSRPNSPIPQLSSPYRVAPQSPDGMPFVRRAGHSRSFDVFAISWLAFGDVEGTGLLLMPRDRIPVADVVAIPDCEVLPEQLVGLLPGVPAESQYARRLAEAGCRVVVPLLINRQRGEFDWGPHSAPSITNREMLYRSAYELGRGLIGYEVQQVLAVVDWFAADAAAVGSDHSSDNRDEPAATRPIGVLGWGEGGLLALYCGALDDRILSVGVSGYFDNRQSIWQEPIDRNVFGLLEQFGDAELATMIAPRHLTVEAARGPVAELPGQGGAPARLVSPQLESVTAEFHRAQDLVDPLTPEATLHLVHSQDGQGPPGSRAMLRHFLTALGVEADVATDESAPVYEAIGVDLAARHRAHMRRLDRHSQQLLTASSAVRQAFMARLDTSSVEAYQRTVPWYRNYFYDEVIGRFDMPLAAPNPRTRLAYETPHWLGYEVVLDVFDSVFAYGLLLVPRDLRAGERRPVVVCQHGLEGRPQDTIGKQGSQAYAGFAGKLAERGFLTFAPQNLYIGEDRFRTLQRKSYPLKKTLFSTIVPQHQQIVNWLKGLAMVDPERIAFYGLSYGGKTAMRVPPLVTDYCLSICSADFNEWVDKNASTTHPRSYVWSGEYEIFEFDLGSTFNYAEMAALIAPRPFMVERGHFDGVADDWTVAWEFAKVRNLYAAQLKLADRCEIEWFDGPHTINGQATFRFLHKHLSWPVPVE
jgi:dienelactone hydrolase